MDCVRTVYLNRIGNKNERVTHMTAMETSRLLADAKWKLPSSSFVASIRKWFEKKGYITRQQAAALENIIDKC
ncbi:MAG: hypothetical protein WC364_13085 [Eubacteriales bacterium]|jgi:ribosomal protein S8